MHRERVSENVYWFQSEVYAQVTAGAVTGPQWAVVIDTLAIPDETLAMRGFIEEQLGVPVRYVINTHYHADHTWGNCFFPGATIISSALCREMMQVRGPRSHSLQFPQTKPALSAVKRFYPHLSSRLPLSACDRTSKNLVFLPTATVTDGRLFYHGRGSRIVAGKHSAAALHGGRDPMCQKPIKTFGKRGENIIQGTATSSCAARSMMAVWVTGIHSNRAKSGSGSCPTEKSG